MPGAPDLSQERRRGSLRTALALAFLAHLPAVSHALVPEPPHVVRGLVTVNGAARTWGTVALRLAGATEPIATFALGALPGAPNGFALAVPMDALDPRAGGAAREDDAAELLLDGAVAGAVTIGARGGQQTVDIASSVPHAIVLVRGPTGNPPSPPSGGAVYLDVAAADTEPAHALSYAWAAVCPGGDQGSFDDPLSPTPVWTAPQTGNQPLACSLTVTIADGQGSSLDPGTVVTVQPTVAPDPVAVISATPDPSLCGEAVSFDGSASFHGNPERTIVLHEWDFDHDGTTFDVEATGAQATHGYGTRAGTVTAALRVSDNGVPPRSAIATREVHPGGVDRPPAAVAGGPYAVSAGASLALDASLSSDPDAACGDAIASWEWDLDGDGAFDDASGPQPVIPWPSLESLLCGGLCVHNQSHPVGLRVTDGAGEAATASAQVAVSLLIFADDFSDGTATGDPHWRRRLGAWTVLGTTPAKRRYASDPVKGGIAVTKPAPLASLLAGRLDTKIALSNSFVVYPNGALIFGYTDNTHYRYARLQQLAGVWKLVLGQVGSIGADAAGVKKAKVLPAQVVGRIYRLYVDAYGDGRVRVWFKTRLGTPAISYKFKAAAAGKVGYQADKARAYFDDFAAWDRGMLP